MRILSLSSFVPEAICDTVRFTQYSGERNIPLYCGYVADFISQVQHDESVDGAIFPKTCDSSRSIRSYLDNIRDKFVYELIVPARHDELAASYYAAELRNYREMLVEHFQIEITDETIRTRMEMLNARNAQIRTMYKQLEKIRYADYLKAIHAMLQLPLEEQVGRSMDCAEIEMGKPVYLVGSFLANLTLTDAIEKAGLTVVGDNLPESGRLVSLPEYAPADDVFAELAKVHLSARLSPTQNDFREILERDIAEIEHSQAAGVVFVMQKYCEPYQYLYAVYEKELAAREIPCTKIMLTDTEDDGKAALILETFAELLEVSA